MRAIKNAFAALAMTLAVAGTACSTGDDSDTAGSPEKAGEQASELVVPAGSETRALGIESWKLDEAGLIQGLGPDAAVVAAFLSHGEERAIESLSPAGGVKNLEEAAAPDTFSPQDEQFYQALIRDMKAYAPPSQTEVSGGIGKIQENVWYGPLACCYGNRAAQYYYWVVSTGYTRYCHVDVFSSYCSGYTSCFNYGYATGCLQWL